MPEESAFCLSFPQPDIGLVTFDDPQRTVNLLSHAVLKQLERQLTALATRDDLAGLVLISAKPNCFLAGADLGEMVAMRDWALAQKIESVRQTQVLLQRLSTFDGVTVAAIRGACLGGGAELALWCDRRIMADDVPSEIGFPEVQLGLHPGWGGTARAPRIVGLAPAAELITQGKLIGAAEAVAIGLADELTTAERLLAAAIDRIRRERRSGQYRIDRQRWRGPVQMPAAEREFLLKTAAAKLQWPMSGQNPATQVALKLLGTTAPLDLDAACGLEAESVAQLIGSATNVALLNVHTLKRRNKKEVGAGLCAVEPHPVQAVAVLGAGTMGSGIAAISVQQQIPVTMYDADPDALARGIEQALQGLGHDPARNQRDADRSARLLRWSRAETDLEGCDLVIEAIVENPEVKKQVYRRIEPRLPPHAILASNTSTIRISELAKALQQPDRLCGMHFFNPVRVMQLVEVIRGEQTSDRTIATAVAFAKRLGKFAIVVHDRPGFLVNRLLGPYLNEALEILAEGTAIRAIEQAATDFGMPVGPLQLYDIVGLDTAFYAGRIMWEAFPDRIKPSPILPALIKRGRLGCKSGAGFFSYPHGERKPQEDPQVDQVICTYRKPRADVAPDQSLADRLILPMLLEATRVLQEQVVLDPRDVDLGLIYGIGFPAVRGGLLYWADSLGIDHIMELLRSVEHLGPRFAPTPLLQSMADTGGSFYANHVSNGAGFANNACCRD